MKASQDGDQMAYRLLLRQATPLIRSMARRRVVDPDLVEDIVQDTLITLHRIRASYDPSLPFEPWLGAITRARAIDALRHQGRTRGREVHDDLALHRHADPTAERQAEAAPAVQALGRMLEVLPQRQREAVELVKLKEMSIDEAARASRLSTSAFKALLHRALARLRAIGSEDNARP